MIQHPLALIPRGAPRRLTLVVIAMIGVWLSPRANDRCHLADGGIIALEQPWSTKRANSVIGTWRAANAGTIAVSNVHWDYMFLLCYSTALALACVMAAGAAVPGSLVARLGPAIAWMQSAAAVFDALENAGMLTMLAGHTASPVPLLTSISSVIKFTLIGVGVVYLLVALSGRQQ